MAQLSLPTQKLIGKYQNWYCSLQPKETQDTTTIHVDEVASRVAAFYEKIRGLVDWREEHLMRRAAIERILKRRLFLGQNGKELANSFVLELIRGGYFPNDQIAEEKIEIIKESINKYVFLFNNSLETSNENTKNSLFDFLLSIAACEVEEILDPPRKERALMDYMFEVIKERIRMNGSVIAEEEKDIQIYIAVQRALFKLDKAIISYHLLKKLYPEWIQLSQAKIEEIAKNIYLILEDIEIVL